MFYNYGGFKYSFINLLFLNILTEMTNFFRSFQKYFGLWPKKNLGGKRVKLREPRYVSHILFLQRNL